MMAARMERRRSSVPSSTKVQIGAHWRKPFMKIYDSTYGSHGRSYEDLLDPAARQRSEDRRRGRNPPSIAQHRLSAVPERAIWSPDDLPEPYMSSRFPTEHVFKPLHVHRSTRSDDVLSIFGVPKVSVPTNYVDQELETFLQKIRSPRDPQLKLMQLERETRMHDDQALRRATRMTANSPEEAVAEMYASADNYMQAARAHFDAY